MALRRWFSWVESARDQLPRWHTLLLLVIHVGIRQRIYKTLLDSPLWTGPKPTTPKADEEEDDDPAEGKEAKAAEGVIRAAAAASSASTVVTTQVMEDPAKGPVRAEEQSVKEVRAKCKNTFYAAGHILAMDSLLAKAILVATM
eukprot:9106677-Lingulodinium_polyedra.AAC.1